MFISVTRKVCSAPRPRKGTIAAPATPNDAQWTEVLLQEQSWDSGRGTGRDPKGRSCPEMGQPGLGDDLLPTGHSAPTHQEKTTVGGGGGGKRPRLCGAGTGRFEGHSVPRVWAASGQSLSTSRPCSLS